ncbi:uncharacterized protein V6R79_000048 [Siganus canaliculatus]
MNNEPLPLCLIPRKLHENKREAANSSREAPVDAQGPVDSLGPVDALGAPWKRWAPWKRRAPWTLSGPRGRSQGPVDALRAPWTRRAPWTLSGFTRSLCCTKGAPSGVLRLPRDGRSAADASPRQRQRLRKRLGQERTVALQSSRAEERAHRAASLRVPRCLPHLPNFSRVNPPEASASSSSRFYPEQHTPPRRFLICSHPFQLLLFFFFGGS